MGLSLASLIKPSLVFVGAGTGGLLRYWLGGLVQHWWGPSFPLGTLLVNISGCLAIGFLGTALAISYPTREEYRMILLVGLIGGYTTFSTFGYETLVLFQSGERFRSALYVLSSVAFCLFAVWIGALVATKFYGPHTP